jgi:glycosyltransferase involved in cell wall biosynthesis
MISVVIPAYNEAAAIERTVSDIRAALGLGPLFEIIVIDDGSTDQTGAIARKSGAKVIRHPHNIGYGRALKDGITAAVYETIVIIDADGTYPAREIPRIVAELDRGFDLAVGARSGDAVNDSWIKAPLRRLLKFLVEFTSGRRVPDVNSGLRAFRRSAIVPYFPQLCDTFSFTTSMTLAYLLTGRFVSYVPITYGERVGTTKVRLLRDTLRTLQYIVQGIVYYNPVKMFLLLSAGAFAVGLVAALFFELTGNGVEAFSIAVGGVLTAILVFALGLVADLLRQILIR